MTEQKAENIIEFEGKQFEIKDIRPQNGVKRAIVKLVNAAPAPDRECELTDFLMCLQAILDKHAQVEGENAIESALEELPASPFIEHDIADIIRQQVEYQCWVDDTGTIHHDVDYRRITELIIETIKNHIL